MVINWVWHYNHKRPHSGLDMRTPAANAAYIAELPPTPSVVAVRGGLRVSATTPAGPVDTLPQDLVDRDFPHIVWTDFSGRLDPARSIARDTAELPHEQASEQAYFDGGAYIPDNADPLIAVWDGKPSGGFGGTYDIVERRRVNGQAITIIWPVGAVRS